MVSVDAKLSDMCAFVKYFWSLVINTEVLHEQFIQLDTD